MREIKFRVWDHNTNTMMIPDNFEFYNGKIGWIDAGVTREEIANKWGDKVVTLLEVPLAHEEL